MSNCTRQARLDEAIEAAKEQIGCRMRCGTCICESCPRDCDECEKRGVTPRGKDCLYEGYGSYRKEEQG